MERGAVVCPLGKFFKLTPENVVHLKLASKFLGDIEALRPSRANIDFLQNDEIGSLKRKELRYGVQAKPSIDVPIHYPDLLPQEDLVSSWRELARIDLFHSERIRVT
jgi:hypothetical protein